MNYATARDIDRQEIPVILPINIQDMVDVSFQRLQQLTFREAMNLDRHVGAARGKFASVGAEPNAKDRVAVRVRESKDRIV